MSKFNSTLSGKKSKRIVILTSVHSWFDIRIFHKEAKSLVRAGYDVILIAQHKRDETIDGVSIIALPNPANRFMRILGLTWLTFRLAIKQKADVYHFHDPELIPVGVVLKLLTSARVIYDVHEDVPKQILTKRWIRSYLRQLIAVSVDIFEKSLANIFDAIIVATEEISDKFKKLNPIVVHNFPDVQMFPIKPQIHNSGTEKTLVYIGGISRIRGVEEMIRAMEHVYYLHNINLLLIGGYEPQDLKMELQVLPGYQKVKLLGPLSWEKAWAIAKNAVAGLVLFHPVPNHQRSLPNKLFEYMAAGIPVVASNFPLWREIIEGNHCGICVDPLKPKEIGAAIESLISNPKEANAMGENGRKAVTEKYNWAIEEAKLLKLYEDLL